LTVQIETYQPFPRQQAFHRSPAKYRLFGGAAGPGKSRALLEEACIHALEVPGAKTIVLRRTFPELEGSIISRFRMYIEPKWRDVKGFRHDTQQHIVYWPNGSLTRFGYCHTMNDVYQYQGDEFLFIGVDELTMWTYEMWSFMTTRNRCPIEGTFSCMAGASNPGNIGHDWVKRVFVLKEPCLEMDANQIAEYDPKEYDFIPARITDNPVYANDANYLKTLNSLSAARKRQFLEGDWSDVLGQYFAEYDREATYIDHDSFLKLWGPQYWHPIWVSIDWGSTHHAYASWHTFVTLPVDYIERPLATPTGTREERRNLILAELQGTQQTELRTRDVPFTFREKLVSGLGEEALAEEIVRETPQGERRRVNSIFLSPDAGFESELQRGVRMGDVFVRRGMPRAQAAFDSRIDGWRLMHDKLRDKIVSKGLQYAGWCITGRCPKLLEAIPWAVADPKRDGDIVKEGDSPLLDVLDGARYGIASYEWAAQRPSSERKKDVIAALPVEGPFRFMADKEFDKNERQSQVPVYIGGLNSKRGKRHGRS
jgi:hypothetical protein